MKLKLFNLNKDGKGVDPNEDTTPNLAYYFKSLWRKLSKLVSINLLAILQFLPLFVAFFTYFWADTEPTTTDLFFPVIDGITQLSPDPAKAVLLMLASPQFNVPVASVGMIVAIAVCVLLFALSFGWCNVGLSYLVRELVNGRPVFIFSDIKHAIKRNAKQGFLFGLLDFAIIFILLFNLYNLGGAGSAGFLSDFFYVGNFAIAILYMIMRFYTYLMLITFDMKIIKILKNALIFVMLGIKRNLLAILWIAVLVGLNVLLYFAFMPLGVIVPILYIVSIPAFTTAYAAYPVIKRYMIDPVAPEEKEETFEPAVISDSIGISAEEMWEHFMAQEKIEDAEYRSWSFGGSNADELAKLVCQGIKTATSSAHPLYATQNLSLPRVGEYNIILNSSNQAVCITQTTKVYVLPFHKITEEHAMAEGEGDKSLKYWTRVHKAYFEKELGQYGLSFNEDMKVVCEQFRVVYRPE